MWKMASTRFQIHKRFLLAILIICLKYVDVTEVCRVDDKDPSSTTCKFTLVESIPENLTYAPSDPILMSTYEAHKRLLLKAKKSIHLSTFYWTLLSNDTSVYDNSSSQGEDIYRILTDIVKGQIVKVKIAQNNTNADTDNLAAFGAEVRTLNFTALVGAGVLHTKMWIVDQQHVYIGSGNFDWRSYTQTKETGVLIEDCPELGEDADKIFQVYWMLGTLKVIPYPWPDNFLTKINMTTPLEVNYNSSKGGVYITSSPPPFCPVGRTYDIDGIINVIRSAKKFIYISVMDYLPLFVYLNPEIYWPVIDNELKRAAIDRKVEVRLLASHWRHTSPEMYTFLSSLSILSHARNLNIKLYVKLFTVPAYTDIQEQIPFARVSHSKYMVTDKHAYIGTSNWSGDYFKYTGGVAFVLKDEDCSGTPGSLRQQLQDVFVRDWQSNYTKPVFG
ncbi:5'-3' exonuclease PLD3-like isoform X2 [Physella acuta]|uniref:5'-3' exonuclease PLD3-like isoform X2 n=1 Tax=Physella acuta TaxID=109671 RepID=UPI0027DBCE61|nr:5'-3' exonuclease PLD3-like isoform X2 [Physella acuta]